MSAGWQDQATCVQLGVPPDMMQPERATPDELAEAMAVCEHCPVKRECHDLAYSQRSDTGQPVAYGVHAGKWWGDPPVSPLVVTCEWCGTTVETDRTGQRYCGPAHRVAAHRARVLSA